jgi:thiol:disulfide interchange protein
MYYLKNYKFVLVFVFLVSLMVSAQPINDLVRINLSENNFKVEQGKQIKFKITATIKNGFHINSNKPNDEFLIPLTITSGHAAFPISKIDFPVPEEFKFPMSDQPVSAYLGTTQIGITINISGNIQAGKYTVPIEFNYQACNDQSCFPPSTITDSITVEVASGSQVSGNKNEIENPNDSVENQSLITSTNQSSSEDNISIFAAILFAFLGGIILNLMPCVLPVLSLKIMGFIQQAGEDKSKTRKHGLAFTIGVVFSFLVLAGFLIALRAGGQYLGWGFQLQSPTFIVILSILLFLFGLSLFGVFEIGTSLTSSEQYIKSSGYTGSFLSGVLATIVATPCTAPFMGTALGFAISQPVYVSLLVFTFLGLGMALPYVVLTSSPKLLKFVPKPGAWMETLKQFMGFLLMATVLWLLWVLSLQTGAEGVLFLLLSFIIASIGGWIYGRWGNITKKLSVRRTAQLISILIIIGALFFSLSNIETKAITNSSSISQGKIKWEAYSPGKVEDAVKEGKPVFVDFTAAWCLSCQVNEKVAFGSDEVQQEFVDKNILALKGDWTNSDPVITKALESFGRNSVPLYVIYSKDKKPLLLPEILTPGIVLDALKNLD